MNAGRFGLQGPAFITEETPSLPDRADLLAEGRKALIDFATRDGYDLRKGDWVAAMRPLRATGERCVQCHQFGNQRPKVGDALGAAMYIYRGPAAHVAKVVGREPAGRCSLTSSAADWTR